MIILEKRWDYLDQIRHVEPELVPGRGHPQQKVVSGCICQCVSRGVTWITHPKGWAPKENKREKTLRSAQALPSLCVLLARQ